MYDLMYPVAQIVGIVGVLRKRTENRQYYYYASLFPSKRQILTSTGQYQTYTSPIANVLSHKLSYTSRYNTDNAHTNCLWNTGTQIKTNRTKLRHQHPSIHTIHRPNFISQPDSCINTSETAHWIYSYESTTWCWQAVQDARHKRILYSVVFWIYCLHDGYGGRIFLLGNISVRRRTVDHWPVDGKILLHDLLHYVVYSAGLLLGVSDRNCSEVNKLCSISHTWFHHYEYFRFLVLNERMKSLNRLSSNEIVRQLLVMGKIHTKLCEAATNMTNVFSVPLFFLCSRVYIATVVCLLSFYGMLPILQKEMFYWVAFYWTMYFAVIVFCEVVTSQVSRLI